MTKNSHRPVCPKKWLTITPLNNDKVKSKQLQPQFQMVSILGAWLVYNQECTVTHAGMRGAFRVHLSLSQAFSCWRKAAASLFCSHVSTEMNF